MTVLSIIAVLLSPVIAVWVGQKLQDRKERQGAKRRVFETLMATRHIPASEEKVRALNMVDVVFATDSHVRQLWREYFDLLCSPASAHTQLLAQQRQIKNLEMLTAMAKVTGVGTAIRDLDVQRVYYPEGVMKADERSQALAEELLRVLRGTKGLETSPRPFPAIDDGKAK